MKTGAGIGARRKKLRAESADKPSRAPIASQALLAEPGAAELNEAEHHSEHKERTGQ